MDLPEAACCDASDVWCKRQIIINQHAETFNAAFWDYLLTLQYNHWGVYLEPVQINSVLSAFSFSLFDIIQLSSSSMQEVIDFDAIAHSVTSQWI